MDIGNEVEISNQCTPNQPVQMEPPSHNGVPTNEGFIREHSWTKRINQIRDHALNVQNHHPVSAAITSPLDLTAPRPLPVVKKKKRLRKSEIPKENKVENFAESLGFLDQVKEKFKSQPILYNQFLVLMKDFKSTSDTKAFMEMAVQLLGAYPQLIAELNAFLPQGYEIHKTQDGTYGIITKGVLEISRSPMPPLPNIVFLNMLPTMKLGTVGAIPTSGSIPAAQFQPPVFVQPQPIPLVPVKKPDDDESINYMTKIKARFQERPEKYNLFMEILEQYAAKKHEVDIDALKSQVRTQVVVLFENDIDLLPEFDVFLHKPEKCPSKPSSRSDCGNKRKAATSIGAKPRPAKKAKKSGDIGVSDETRKFEVASFFNKVQDCLQTVDRDSFVRSCDIFKRGLISECEMLSHAKAVIRYTPKRVRSWYKELIRKRQGIPVQECAEPASNLDTVTVVEQEVEKEVEEEDEYKIVEIDLSERNRVGTSYYALALPESLLLPKCPGRTDLCNEILNDVCVSIPSFTSRPSGNASECCDETNEKQSNVSLYDDQRFELDVLIETNAAAINALENVTKTMRLMTRDEQLDFRLDDCIGGTSATLNQVAVRRIYGEEHSAMIIQGLKDCPFTSVPVVLKRLKLKEQEWRKVQRSFNKTWSSEWSGFNSKPESSSSDATAGA